MLRPDLLLSPDSEAMRGGVKELEALFPFIPPAALAATGHSHTSKPRLPALSSRSPVPSTLSSRCCLVGPGWGTSTRAGPYLVECKGAYGVCGQLHCVQQGHLNEAVGLGAPGWPVLVALHLQGDKWGRCKGAQSCPKAQTGRGPRGKEGWEV